MDKRFYLLIAFLCFQMFVPMATAQVGGGTEDLVDDLTEKAKDKVADSGVIPVGALTEIQRYKERAEKVYRNVVDNAKFQDILNGKQLDLPFAIKKEGVPFYIIIDSIVLEPRVAYVDAYCVIEDPKDPSKRFIFAGKHVKFSRHGGFTGTGRLELIDAPPILIGPTKNPFMSIQLLGPMNDATDPLKAIQSMGPVTNDPTRRTYVEFECKGFKKLHINADITFSKDYINPEGPDGKVLKDKTVKLPFETDVTNGSGWIIDLNNVPKFQFKKLPGYTFQIEEACFDQHQEYNPRKLNFPANYGAEDLGMSWTGFFGSNIKMWLPKGFKKKSTANVPNSERTYIQLKRLIFDEQGFTLDARGKNLISESNSNGKWKFTLDTMNLDIVKNQLKNLDFKGKLELPLQDGSEPEKKFQYDGFVTFNDNTKILDYRLNVVLQNSIKANCFIGDLSLDKNSSVSLTYTDDEFEFATNLNGNLDISGKGEGDGASNKDLQLGVSFTGLRLSTTRDYFSVSTLAVHTPSGGGGTKVGAAEVSISSIGLASRQEAGKVEKGLRFTMSVEMNGNDDGSDFGGKGTFTIWASHDIDDKWKFKAVEFNSLRIDVDNDFFTLHGEINQETGNEYWGDFYGGSIDMTLMGNKIKVAVDGRFGKKGEKKYWGVNGAAGGFKIKIAPPIAINMFSGGLTKGMKVVSESTSNTGEIWHAKSTDMYYKFDENMGLNVLAGIGIVSVPEEKTFAGNISFTVGFYEDGGLDVIAFTGGVAFLAKESGEAPDAEKLYSDTKDFQGQDYNNCPTKPKIVGVGEAQITLGWNMVMDFTNKTFTGAFNIWADVANGSIYGAYNDKCAGTMNIYFSNKDWYVYIGKPVQPISLKIDLKVAHAQSSSYFMIGSILPNPPIASIPPQFRAPIMNYDALEVGGGIAFGTRIDINAFFGVGGKKKKKCSVTIGLDLWATAGFDLLVQKSNETIYCSNNGGKARGINDWYATGQMFLGGGAKFTAGGKCGPIGAQATLAGVELYLYLIGQVPNPNYFRGGGHGEMDILGIVNIDFDFKVEFGKRCTFADTLNPNDRAIKIIADITPQKGVENASVYTKPQIFFEHPLNQEIKMNLENDGAYSSGTPIKIRPVIDLDECQYSINDVPQPENSFTIHVAENGLSATLVPAAVIPSNAKVEVFVTVGFEKYNNGTWVASTDFESDTMSTVFKVGQGKNNIELSNVRFAYPSPGMTNFYKDEYPTGYLTTISVPTQALTVDPSMHKMEVSIKGNGMDYKTNNVTISTSGQRQISYPLPDNFKAANQYTITLYKKAVNSTYANDTLITYNFKTSTFPTFSAKVGAMSIEAATVADYNVTLGLPQSADENLSAIEVSGSRAGDMNLQNPLISIESMKWSSEYEQKFTSVFAMFTGNYLQGDPTLHYEAAEISSAGIRVDTWKMFKYQVDQGIININFDYFKIVNDSDPKGAIPSNAVELDNQRKAIAAKIPVVANGQYKILLKYTLPGETIPNTSAYMTYRIK